jgi:hypothetical protein
VSDSGCSTAVVIGLSRQIADEPRARTGLAAFDSSDTIVFTNSALPYLESDALADLGAVAQSHAVVNSAFRTVAQQYLLVEWFHQPLRHHGGREHRYVEPRNRPHSICRARAPRSRRWRAGVESRRRGDDAHFDHATSPTCGEDTRVQRLWNATIEDPIGVDGQYGPGRSAARAGPATGFAKLATCATWWHAAAELRRGAIDRRSRSREAGDAGDVRDHDREHRHPVRPWSNAAARPTAR